MSSTKRPSPSPSSSQSVSHVSRLQRTSAVPRDLEDMRELMWEVGPGDGVDERKLHTAYMDSVDDFRLLIAILLSSGECELLHLTISCETGEGRLGRWRGDQG
jgi:hypothetical protein